MTEIYDAHRHLYHYTNFEGVKGILESRTLWATHYNGDCVIVHARRNGKLKVLCREVIERGDDLYLVPRSNDPRFREELRWHPRAVSRWGVPAVGEEEDLPDGPRVVALVVGYHL